MELFRKIFLFLLVFTPPEAQAQGLPDAEWNARFERSEGWLGADGVYSIRLTKLTSDTRSPNVAFLFSDTIWGTTRENGHFFDKISMTNHSAAIFSEGKLHFISHQDDEGKPKNFLPEPMWLQDGLVWNARLFFTAFLFDARTWRPRDVALVSVELDSAGHPDFALPRVERAPLTHSEEGAQVVFGCAILDDADENFIYIYGYADHFARGSRKDLVVARVERAHFDDFSQWTFFDGTDWQKDIRKTLRPEAALVRNVASEFSMSRVPSGTHAGALLFVYTPDGISRKVAFRLAESPVGPFGEEVVFYHAPEPDTLGEGIYCYNAKGHPALSQDDAILVSYHVNRFRDIAHRPAEYRPRFVRLRYSALDAPAARE
ncbi:MAG: hypothetical protein Q4D38_11940 [Planctomycetia bacterium]|nr:hypothetical protein [Planctomycetia bacterium]